MIRPNAVFWQIGTPSTSAVSVYEVGGDKTAAARVLGVSVRTLQRRAKERDGC